MFRGEIMEAYLDKRRTKMTEIIRLKQVEMESEYSRFQVRGSAEVVPFIQELIGDDSQEALVALFLDIKNKVSAFSIVFRGETRRCIFNPKQIMQRALLTNSSRVILAHNHPAGSLNPSLQDEDAVRKVKAAGELMDIQVIDNMIITKDGYYSFAENNIN